MDIGRCCARSLAVVAAVPDLEFLEAVTTSARGSSPGVERGVLVKGYQETRVPVAEDVAAFAAVMTAGEVAERALAGRIIAN